MQLISIFELTGFQAMLYLGVFYAVPQETHFSFNDTYEI